MKHTPGPWNISELDYGDELWFGGEGCGLIYVNGWANGGEKEHPERWAQMLADARLIAAAPDMLATLQDLLAMCERQKDFNEDADGRMLERTRAAIAKATEGEG